MDTTDPEIEFDEQGVCNHCHKFDQITLKNWFPNDEGRRRLDAIVGEIKKSGQGKPYDSIIGLSGGVDSSYLALKVHEFGLRPLVVHVDAGWNSELAVHNIERVVKFCGFDLHTHVMPWEEVRDLQVAYMRAGVANQDVIQDHAFFASLYRFAVKSRIKYVLSGGNIATESVFPHSWHHSAMDAVNLLAIHRKHGSRKLRDYKTISFLAYYLYYPFVRGMTVVRPLNFMPYDKREALAVLKRDVGYKEYGGKHGESRFTKFFQNHYLPKKFGYDKRRPHLSSLILSGQLTRDEALATLDEPLYDPAELQEDFAFVAKKLQMSIGELQALIEAPGRPYSDFANWDQRYRFMKLVRRNIERILGRSFRTYS